jgi:pyridoxine 5-phosphate synthase
MAGSTALSVNLNKVALLRNARSIDIPSVERAAHVALDAGAAGVTVHPRPDGRHILPQDVRALAQVVREYGDRELNLEGNPFSGAGERGARSDYPGFMALVREAAASGGIHQVTLVPDSPEQSTSDHGWKLGEWAQALGSVVEELHGLGARVSLFLDPVPEAMATASQTGAERVELYTEPFARAFGTAGRQRSLDEYVAAAGAARRAGLGVNAGHDLNLENLGSFVRSVPDVLEVSIGHALVADALMMGLAAAVRTYLAVIEDARAT